MLRFGAALNQRVAALSAGLPHGIETVKVADQSAVVSDAVRVVLSGFLLKQVVIVWPFHLSLWATGGAGCGCGNPAGSGR